VLLWVIALAPRMFRRGGRRMWTRWWL